MVKNFVEMVNEKIENEDLLTIGMKYRDFNSTDSIVPDSINADSAIRIKGEWMDMIIPVGYEIAYDEFEGEYIIKYNDMTFYFS